MIRRFAAGAAVIVAIVGFAGITPAVAQPVTLFTTVFNTNVVYAGVGGMRSGDGTGTITLTGVSGKVTKALLFWHGPTKNDDNVNANANVSFAGKPVVGTEIGVSSSNCWDESGYTNSYSYRADVTSLVHGNGSFALANFVKNNDVVDINGVSLVVFYDDGNKNNNRDVVLFDGNDSNDPFAGPPADPAGWDVSLPNINYTSGTASLDMVVSDGQNGDGFDDGAIVVNGTTIVPAGQIFSGTSVPSMGQDNDGGLWDNKSFPVTSVLKKGKNTLHLTSDEQGDCLSLVVAAVNLPAGAAPGQPTTTTTTEPPTTTTTAAQPVVVAPTFTG